MSEMRVIFTIAGLSAEDGGPSRSTIALARELTELGVRVELLTCSAASGVVHASTPPALNARIHVLPEACRRRQWYARWNGFYRFLRSQACGAATIIHDTGLWLANNHASAVAARRFHVPLVLSPRGMLSGWCLRYRGLKKQIAWRLYQHRDVTSASLLHATSPAEAEDFRSRHIGQPIAVIPNGVDLPNRFDLQGSLVRKAPGFARRCRTVLFLSRLHPKKGLLELVQAWATLRPRDWRVVVAGGGSADFKHQVEQAVLAQGLGDAFEFIGEVSDRAKWEVYHRADLFALPSKSENFGLVIGEALAAGVPVITTRQTPWPELAQQQCGWWIKDDLPSLVQALAEATRLTDEKRHEMGERGRELIATKYSWQAVAREMKAAYEWLSGAAGRPSCILPAQD